MRIKKFKNNEYILAENVWVRNLCLSTKPLDINNLTKKEIYIFLKNEQENIRNSNLKIENIESNFENLIIFSDGYDWSNKQKILGKIPKSITKTIGVNGSLAKWEMVGEKAETKRTMTFYLVNNPYPECLGYLPRNHNYYPNLISSTKTNPEFLKKYRNDPFLYQSTTDSFYSGIDSDNQCLKLDDYRNPICAALSFAWKKQTKKIVLFCCDEAFKENRPASIKMKNGLYQYPQQILCQKIIDKQLYWLKKNGVEIMDCSSGIEYENADYIHPENILSFLEK